MATSYCSNTKLRKPAVADRNWNVPLNENADLLESLAPVAGLLVSAVELPSASLNVRVASGSFAYADGTQGTYAGVASQAIADNSTKMLYLDATGALTVGAAFPATAHVPLATVVTASGVISSITDNRSCFQSYGPLVSAADDAAAAAANVPIGAMYHNSGAVRIRLS